MRRPKSRNHYLKFLHVSFVFNIVLGRRNEDTESMIEPSGDMGISPIAHQNNDTILNTAFLVVFLSPCLYGFMVSAITAHFPAGTHSLGEASVYYSLIS